MIESERGIKKEFSILISISLNNALAKRVHRLKYQIILYTGFTDRAVASGVGSWQA